MPETAAFAPLAGRFQLFFQPEYELASRRIVGLEALLRWWHDDFGMLSPHPALRGTRHAARLPAIERWAVEAGCRQGGRWAGEEAGRISLNVSARHLLGGSFPGELAGAMARARLAPERVAIDVPGRALADHAGLREQAAALADLGVGLCLDLDEPLPGIAHCPFRPASVKLPLSTGRRGDGPLHPSVHATLAAAEVLGAATVAKAVGTPEQLELATEAGFDRAFGQALSAPVTPEAATLLIRANARPVSAAG